MSDPASYADDDLVYVDPAAKKVLGKVEFDERGNPKARPYPRDRGQAWRDFFPCGTYRGMKRAFRVGGKVAEEKGQATLDEVLPKFLNDAL
jgi:hypothetical protein